MVESSYRQKLSSWTTDEAIAKLQSDDEEVRELAVKVLIYDLSHLEFISACLPLLNDLSAEIRGTVLHDIYDVLRPYHFGYESEIESSAQMEQWIAGLIQPVANLICDPNPSIAYHACEVIELMAQNSSSNIGCAQLMAALDDARKRLEVWQSVTDASNGTSPRCALEPVSQIRSPHAAQTPHRLGSEPLRRRRCHDVPRHRHLDVGWLKGLIERTCPARITCSIGDSSGHERYLTP